LGTIRSKYSFEQFEEVLQKLAHKAAIEAVTKPKGRYVRIAIDNGRFTRVETDEYMFVFYENHVSFHKSGPDGLSFDVEEKLYSTSNDRSKISFEVFLKEDTEKVKKRISAFVEKIMAEAGMKPQPRFRLKNIGSFPRRLDSYIKPRNAKTWKRKP